MWLRNLATRFSRQQQQQQQPEHPPHDLPPRSHLTSPGPGPGSGWVRVERNPAEDTLSTTSTHGSWETPREPQQHQVQRERRVRAPIPPGMTPLYYEYHHRMQVQHQQEKMAALAHRQQQTMWNQGRVPPFQPKHQWRFPSKKRGRMANTGGVFPIQQPM